MKDLLLRDSRLPNLISDENFRQVHKWGIQDRSPFEWLTYAAEELGELAKAISEQQYRGGPPENIVKEAIQTATLCLEIAEMYLPQRVEFPILSCNCLGPTRTGCAIHGANKIG